MFLQFTNLGIAIVLVVLNGFFVAAEFALVKVRGPRLEELLLQRRFGAKTAVWLFERMEATLSACQVGITMASLGLGWVGEPAFAQLIEPLMHKMGVESAAVVHTVSFIVAFTLITAIHLVLGEQLPKIYAIRRSEPVLLALAYPMKFFYYFFFPLLVSVNTSTTFLLRRLGVADASGHGEIHSEDEIRAMLRQAHLSGEVGKSKHRLLESIFEFDDIVCRRVMLPRADAIYFDVSRPFDEIMDTVTKTRHTRYPVCVGSMDEIVGVVHIKDFLGVKPENFDLRALARKPQMVPETMPVSRLLRHFQTSQQHMAFVVDEYGTVEGIVTLENVLEQIVGPVEDEFDTGSTEISKSGDRVWIVEGTASLHEVNRQLGLKLDETAADTLSGLLTARLGRILQAGDKYEMVGGAKAEVLDTAGSRAGRVRITLKPKPGSDIAAL